MDPKSVARAIEDNAHFIKLDGKRAVDTKWQEGKTAVPRAEIGGNAGLLLEHANITDIDLDSPEFAAMVGRFVRTDTLTIGRGGNPSHLLYQGEMHAHENMKDLDGHKMVEIRHKGKQVMWSGSVHPETGEIIQVLKDVPPLPVPDEEDILKAYTAAVIAKYLPSDDRHNLALAYAGFLLRKGLEENEVYQILEAAWTYRNAPPKAFDDLSSIVADTKRKLDAGETKITGGNTLTREIPGMVEALGKAWPWERTLTPEERVEEERQERVSRAQDAWNDTQVQKIAKSRNVLERFHHELKKSGVVGEERLIKLLFLSGHSRLLDRPISLIIKGPSSSGKSYVTEQALINPQPDHAVKFLTGMSEHALVYSEDDYRHKIINIAEQAGINSEFLDYTIRTLLSENRIEYETVAKIDGEQKAVKKSKEGPTGLVLATTKASLYHDNETRAVSIWTTDTQEQTTAIMEATADEDRAGMDFEPWKAYGTWLEGQCNEVWIPYAKSLARDIRAMHVRQRRDFKLLLNAIKTLAIMHQTNRERDSRGRIVATLADYEMARELLNDLLSQGIGATVSKEMRETVAAVKALTTEADPERDHATNKDVVAQLGLDKSSVSTRVNKALTDGYLVNLQEPGKRGNKLAVGSDLPGESSLLPEPEKMARAYVNRELETVCNLVGRLGANHGGKPDPSLFVSLVGWIVGLAHQTKPSVRAFEKPYDDVFGKGKPNKGDEHHRDTASGLAPPISAQPSNYVAKPHETVSSGCDSADAKLTHPTKLDESRADDALTIDDPWFWEEEYDPRTNMMVPRILLEDVEIPKPVIPDPEPQPRAVAFDRVITIDLTYPHDDPAEVKVWEPAREEATNPVSAYKAIQEIRNDWADYDLPTDAEWWVGNLEANDTPFTLEAVELALAA